MRLARAHGGVEQVSGCDELRIGSDRWRVEGEGGTAEQVRGGDKSPGDPIVRLYMVCGS